MAEENSLINKKIKDEQINNTVKKLVFFEELVIFLETQEGINIHKAIEYRDAYRGKYKDLLKF